MHLFILKFPRRKRFSRWNKINICLTTCFGCLLRTFEFSRWRKLRKTWPVQRIFVKSKPRSLVGSWKISKSNTRKRFARFLCREMSSEGLSSKSSYSREHEYLSSLNLFVVISFWSILFAISSQPFCVIANQSEEIDFSANLIVYCYFRFSPCRIFR